MKITRPFLTTALLAATLAWPGLARAGTRKAPTARPSMLSQQERFCEELGKFTLAVGINRNVGVSLFASLRHSRAQGSPAHMQALYEDIIKMVYAKQAISPLGLQQTIESVCLTEMTTPAATPTRANDRY